MRHRGGLRVPVRREAICEFATEVSTGTNESMSRRWVGGDASSVSRAPFGATSTRRVRNSPAATCGLSPLTTSGRRGAHRVTAPWDRFPVDRRSRVL